MMRPLPLLVLIMCALVAYRLLSWPLRPPSQQLHGHAAIGASVRNAHRSWSLDSASSGHHHYFIGYREVSHRLGMWNAVPHILKVLNAHGFSEGQREVATVLVVPNHGHVDWRKWPLSPLQRINRLWGMMHMSRKGALHHTLDAHYGTAGCPFTPTTHDLEELVRHDGRGVRRLVSSQQTWLLKAQAHRGQGVRLVGSPTLLAALTGRLPAAEPATDAASAAAVDETRLSELQRWLRTHRSSGILLQNVIASPLLVHGHKFSLRLYALITCAEPLRVYLHEDGFALFASHPCAAASAARPATSPAAPHQLAPLAPRLTRRASSAS